MSHFSYLKSEFPTVYEAAVKAEDMALSDPRGAAFYARRAVELTVNWVFKHDVNLQLPHHDNISALVHEASFVCVAGQLIVTKSKLIIKLGNRAVHSEYPISQHDAISVLRELTHVTYWLARTYARSRLPVAPTFDQSNLSKATGDVVKLAAAKLKILQDDLAAKDEKLSEILANKSWLNDELKALRAEVAKRKFVNSKASDTHDYDEETTRDYFIDLLLKEAGWLLNQDRDREYEVKGMPNDTGIGFVDYVLWGDDGKPLAVVEVKRTKRDPRVGQNQAKLYADCLEIEFSQRPIIFYSNGYEHYIWDDVLHPPRNVQGFYNKDELALAIQRRTSRKMLSVDDVNLGIIERPYQLRAIQRIIDSFQNDNRRKALLVMATGTGKTRTVIALSDLLMQKNWIKRTLFLADRVALVNQAVSEFKKHLPNASVVNLVKDRIEKGRVYVSTYSTMMGLIDGKSDETHKFGVGYFDLVVIDEAHRSIYQKYRAIFEYFDSYLVGLTATPREEIDRNTYSLFDLGKGMPTDSYTLDEAIEAGYLVPPVLISVPLKFQRDGIKYDELSEESKEEWDALDWSEDGEKPDKVSADAVNRWLFNADTVDKVIANVMQDGIKVAGGDRLGKTIVFAKNQFHAEFIFERFNINYPHYKGQFAQVITSKTEYVQNLIDNFSIVESMPHIAISVDMLDTGIDVPEVANLVLFKLIRSKTKFWQMLGRGTRLCPNLLCPGQDKSEFYVFDYCQNLEYFSQDIKKSQGSSSISLTERLFQLKMEIIQAIDIRNDAFVTNILQEEGVLNKGIVFNEIQIRKNITTELLNVIQAMDPNNFIVRANRKYVEKYACEDAWQKIDEAMINEVIECIAPLPSAHIDFDEAAKHFDVLCFNLQLCILKSNKGFEKYAEQVVKIVESLIERQEVPAIKSELSLLLCVVEQNYWQDITVPVLEVLRVRVRKLVKHIDKSGRAIVYTNFEDKIGEAMIVSATHASERSFLKFRENAKIFLRQNLSHLVINKLYTNKSLTTTDLTELECFLINSGIGDKKTLDKAAEQFSGLGMFVRSLLGLDKSVAREIFSGFISGKKLNADQHQFIKLIIDYLTERGVVSASALYESPFTNAAPQGPDSIFSSEQVDKIIQVLDEIEKNAYFKDNK